MYTELSRALFTSTTGDAQGLLDGQIILFSSISFSNFHISSRCAAGMRQAGCLIGIASPVLMVCCNLSAT